MRRLLVTGMVAASACACSDDDDAAHAWLDPPAVAGRQLALIDSRSEQLRLFDVAAARGDSVPSRALDLPEAPYAIWPREGARADLLVAAGERGGEQEPQLAVIEPDGDVRSQRLASTYTALAQTDDGSHAVAHVLPGMHVSAAAAAQLAIVDLQQAGGAASEVGMDLDGQPWSALWLTPALQLADGALHLLLTSYERHLGVLALEQPEDGPQFVVLTGERSRAARVTQLVSVPDQARVAWIAEGLDDLFVLTLQRSDDARGHALEVAQFAAGAAPSGLALAELADGPALLVLAGEGRELRVLDPGSGEGPLLELDDPARAIAACSPSCTHALLYTPGSASVTLVDAALAAAGEPGALRPLRLTANVASVTIANDRSHAYCLHEQGGVTWIDLEAGTLQSIALGRGEAESVQLAEDGSVWIAAAGGDLVTRIDPAARMRSEVRLDAAIARLVLVPEAERAVVIHAGERLALSVLDAASPAHDTLVYAEDLP